MANRLFGSRSRPPLTLGPGVGAVLIAVLVLLAVVVGIALRRPFG